MAESNSIPGGPALDDGDTLPDGLDEELECQLLQTPDGRQMLAKSKMLNSED